MKRFNHIGLLIRGVHHRIIAHCNPRNFFQFVAFFDFQNYGPLSTPKSPLRGQRRLNRLVDLTHRKESPSHSEVFRPNFRWKHDRCALRVLSNRVVFLPVCSSNILHFFDHSASTGRQSLKDLKAIAIPENEEDQVVTQEDHSQEVCYFLQ
jgi:hypothetical protein